MRALLWFRVIGRSLTWWVLAAGSIAITVSSVVYFDADELPAFVIEKLPLPLEDVWMAALRVHVISAAFALPACLLLSTTLVLRRAPGLHRWLGRTAGGVVLFALAPSGFYLSLFAKGGLPATLGFILSGLIVIVAMVQGIRTARAGAFAAHRRWALHVVAQLSVAVISRAMLFGLDAINFDPERAYLVSLWLPVLACAALVELLVPRPRPASRRDHEEITDRRVVVGSHAVLRDAARA